MKAIAALISVLSLAVCIGAAIWWFLGRTSEDTYKVLFLVASIAYFVFATLWARRPESVRNG